MATGRRGSGVLFADLAFATRDGKTPRRVASFQGSLDADPPLLSGLASANVAPRTSNTNPVNEHFREGASCTLAKVKEVAAEKAQTRGEIFSFTEDSRGGNHTGRL